MARNWANCDVADAKFVLATVVTFRNKAGDSLTRFYNPHLSDAEWNTLHSAAAAHLAYLQDKKNLPFADFTLDPWPIDKPVFHPYVPAKSDGFYGQYKHLKHAGNVYIHQMSALINYCSSNPDVTDGDTITQLVEDAQASHIYQGFPTAARDINPRYVVFENGVVNRSRWYCNLALAGNLRQHFGLSIDQSEAYAPIVASQPLDPTADYADDYNELGSGVGYALGVVMGTELRFDSYSSAIKAVQSCCEHVHNPPCKFWDYGQFPEIPKVSALCVASTKVGNRALMDAAKAGLEADVSNLIERYAALVPTPPVFKKRRSQRVEPQPFQRSA